MLDGVETIVGFSLKKLTITPPAGAGCVKVIELIALPPGDMFAGSNVRDTIAASGVAGVTVSVAELAVNPVCAVIVADAGAAMNLVSVPGFVGSANETAVWPSGITRLSGAAATVASVVVKLTATPPEAAGAPRETVAVTVAPGVALEESRVNDARDSAGFGFITNATCRNIGTVQFGHRI
jgi:hypothetical protein